MGLGVMVGGRKVSCQACLPGNTDANQLHAGIAGCCNGAAQLMLSSSWSVAQCSLALLCMIFTFLACLLEGCFPPLVSAH